MSAVSPTTTSPTSQQVPSPSPSPSLPTHPPLPSEYPMSQLSSISPPAWVPTGSPPRHSIRLSFGTTPEPWNKRSAWREKKKKKKKNPNRGGGGGSEGVKRVLRKQARGVEVEVSKEGEMDFYLN